MASPTAWEEDWRMAQPKISAMQANLAQSNSPNPRTIRVGQLDSELLDQELASLLREPINRALPLISSTLKTHFEPELSLLIQLVLYKFSIWDTGASYGARLQDLRYVVSTAKGSSTMRSRISRRTLLSHGALTLLIPYARERLRSYALSHAWPDAPSSDRRKKAWDLLDLIESTHTLLGLLNFTVFLWNGQYRTLTDRLLRMRLVPSRRQVKRDVSYEFMNRQMVWHAFTEFLLFLLPLIDAKMVRKRVYRLAALFSPSPLLALLPFKSLAKLGLQLPTQTASSSMKQGKYSSLPESQCAICAENASFNLNPSDPSNAFTSMAASTPLHPEHPTGHDDIPSHPIHIPYITSCGHLYCYHCLAERMVQAADGEAEDQGWECLRCGTEVKRGDRYSVEVPETDLDVSGSEYEFSSDLDMYTDMSGSMGSYTESTLSE